MYFDFKPKWEMGNIILGCYMIGQNKTPFPLINTPANINEHWYWRETNGLMSHVSIFRTKYTTSSRYNWESLLYVIFSYHYLSSMASILQCIHPSVRCPDKQAGKRSRASNEEASRPTASSDPGKRWVSITNHVFIMCCRVCFTITLGSTSVRR